MDESTRRRAAERRRTQALDSIAVAPTTGNDRLDHITGVAQQLFGVAMVAVTLLDADRQWFKSRRGIDVEWLPREISFCDAAAEGEDALVVADLTQDPRFRENPLVTGEERIRFYAGHPIAIPGGPPLGTLCLIDRRHHDFGDAERDLLRELAQAVEQELTQSEEMQRAAEVQRSLLPPGPPHADGWEFAAMCEPSRAVGGDFTDWYHHESGDLVLSFADVMGKGVGAGIVAATVRAALRTAGRTRGPAEAVTAAAAALDDDLQQTGTLVTLMHARLDPRTGGFTRVDAGHGLHMVLRRDGRVERQPSNGLPLGVVPNDTWTENRTVLEPGDLSMAFSDGLLDLFDGTLAALDEIWRMARAAGSPRALIRAVRELAADRPLPDDLTVTALQRLPSMT